MKTFAFEQKVGWVSDGNDSLWFPYPNYGNGFFIPFPFPVLGNNILAFPSRSWILGTFLLLSLPVPKLPKLILVHPLTILLLCFVNSSYWWYVCRVTILSKHGNYHHHHHLYHWCPHAHPHHHHYHMILTVIIIIKTWFVIGMMERRTATLCRALILLHPNLVNDHC